MLGFRHFISAILTIVLLAGGVPYLMCTPAVCAANTDCAEVHCDCCGPGCTWPKSTKDSHQPLRAGSQQCPLAIESKPVMANNPHAMVIALLSINPPVPFQLAVAPATPSAVHSNNNSPSPTLLSLSCALTI